MRTRSPAAARRHRIRSLKSLTVLIAALVLIVALVLTLLALGVYIVANRDFPSDADRIATGFPERQMRFIDGRICRTDGYGDYEAQRGMMMLEKARVTDRVSGETSCGTRWDIATANELIIRSTERIGRDDDLKVVHAGGLNLSRIYLTYGGESVRGKPLLPRAGEVLKRLRYYASKGVDSAKSDNGVFDVDLTDTTPRFKGTENQQLQQITVALLLTEVFAGESYDGHTMANYRAFYRQALFSYLQRGGKDNKFVADMPSNEKDSLGYAHVYLGDLWALRDFAPDATVRQQAEILIDRQLTDYAEDAVKRLYTGYSGRHYHRNQVNGAPTHVQNYLLFDNLGYTPTAQELADRSGWGNWLHMAIVTSDYNPASPVFPRALIDLARNKEDGYLVQDGRRPAANWVEDDFALGFNVGGEGAYDSQQGGFYINNSTDARMGLQVAPYVASPYTNERLEIEAGAFLHKNKPFRRDRGVVDRRTAIVKIEHKTTNAGNSRYPAKLKARLWVQHEPDNAFDSLEQESGWLFLEEHSPHRDRDVYLAVTAPVGGYTQMADTQEGKSFQLNDAENGYTVWEVGTTEDYASYDAFKRDVLDNELSITDSAIAYESSQLGSTLTYDRVSDTSHLVNGSAVEWDDFAYSVHSPYAANAHGSHQMELRKSGYTARYDWDPDGDEDYDEPPVKTVSNGQLLRPEEVLGR